METIDNDNFDDLTEQALIETLIEANQSHKSLKKELLLLQFRVKHSESNQVMNTMTFINLPCNKSQDENCQRIVQLINGLGYRPQGFKSKAELEYNVLVINHFLTKGIQKYFMLTKHPTKALFNQTQVVFSRREIRKVINSNDAIEILRIKFDSEVSLIEN